jgi:signal transduction histidine kinase
VDALPLRIFDGDSPARAAARAVDWSQTGVGAPRSWPPCLLTALGILFSSKHPMFLWWGPELVQFYNDAYLPSFGEGKHPAAMGQRGADCWQEIWPVIYPQIADVRERGLASWNQDQLVPIHRNGRIEDVYWTYGYSPVFDEAGAVGGVLVVCTETTSGVLAVRRLNLVRELGAALNEAQDFSDVVRLTEQCLASAQRDVPHSVFTAEGSEPRLVGLDPNEPALVPAATSRDWLRPRALSRPLLSPLWPEPITHAVVHRFELTPGAALTFGLNPCLPFDEAYRSFLQQLVEQITSVQGRIAIAIERRRLLLQAPVATALLTGPDHVFELANPRYVRMVGREVAGKRYVDAFPELRGTALPTILDRVYQRGEPFVADEMQVRLASDQGGPLEPHYLNISLEPIRDLRGNVYGMMAVAVDLTPQVLARNSLERSHEERTRLLEAVQAASRAKDEFLAMLGHELRNPLAPILTAVEVIRGKKVPGVERERDIIERQASHLVKLVDDLLDVSRVVAGKIELKKRRVELAQVISSAIEMATPLLEKRRHELKVEVPSFGLDVFADSTRLAQVVANMLTNAARYTEPGGSIRIHATSGAGAAVLRVEDNGIGISAEQLPHLFERFFQGQRTPDRAHGGLGIGLALVESLIQLHGGTVRAESAGLGKGSAFEVRIPLATTEASSQPWAAPTPAAAVSTAERILLVDDSEDITDLFSTFLELSGLDVKTAHDGPTALKVAAEYRPTVAILDLGLPVMDGYEVAAKLLESLGAAAPRLIAMSGYGQEDDLQRTRRAGFERHLVKPVDTSLLLRAIAGV